MPIPKDAEPGEGVDAYFWRTRKAVWSKELDRFASELEARKEKLKAEQASVNAKKAAAEKAAAAKVAALKTTLPTVAGGEAAGDEAWEKTVAHRILCYKNLTCPGTIIDYWKEDWSDGTVYKDGLFNCHGFTVGGKQAFDKVTGTKPFWKNDGDVLDAATQEPGNIVVFKLQAGGGIAHSGRLEGDTLTHLVMGVGIVKSGFTRGKPFGVYNVSFVLDSKESIAACKNDVKKNLLEEYESLRYGDVNPIQDPCPKIVPEEHWEKVKEILLEVEEKEDDDAKVLAATAGLNILKNYKGWDVKLQPS
jgi:hypothetical protein